MRLFGLYNDPNEIEVAVNLLLAHKSPSALTGRDRVCRNRVIYENKGSEISIVACPAD
jgi:hypothetical protein